MRKSVFRSFYALYSKHTGIDKLREAPMFGHDETKKSSLRQCARTLRRYQSAETSRKKLSYQLNLLYWLLRVPLILAAGSLLDQVEN